MEQKHETLPVYPVTFYPLALALFDPMRERRQMVIYANWLASIGPDGRCDGFTYGSNGNA